MATGLCVSKLGKLGGEGGRGREEGGWEREIWKYVVSMYYLLSVKHCESTAFGTQ